MNKEEIGMFDNMPINELEDILKECEFNFLKVDGQGGVFIKEEFKEAQITRLEQSLQYLKEKLLPDRPEQYKAMAAGYINKIKELRGELNDRM